MDKTIFQKSSNRIKDIIHQELKKNGINKSITKMTVSRILYESLGKPPKIKKVFYLNDKQKQEKVKFCEEMPKRDISVKAFSLLMKQKFLWVPIILT